MAVRCLVLVDWTDLVVNELMTRVMVGWGVLGLTDQI